jgi:hypothetical protein
MSRLFALKTSDGWVATFKGRALVHDCREELEFLFPRHEVVEISGTGIPIMWVKHHPQVQSVTFPLDRSVFQ